MVESIKDLRNICQAPVIKENTWYARKFTRKISIYFTKLFLYTPISANQMTLLFILIGLISGAFFVFGDKFSILYGALVLQLWYIFDHVDGEIARYRKQASLTGEYLDYMSHYIIHPFIFVTMTFGVYNKFSDVSVFIFGFLSAISIILIDLSMATKAKVVVGKALKIVKAGGSLLMSEGVAASKDEQKKGLMHLLINAYSTFVGCIFIYPGVMNVILFGAIADMFIGKFSIGTINLNMMYLILIFYGITMPIISLLGIWMTLKEKGTEKAWEKLFGKIER